MKIEVRNDHGDKPLHCGGSFMFPEPNAYAIQERGWSEWIVVPPGQSAIVNKTRVPVDLAVADIYTECGISEPFPLRNIAIQDVTTPPDPGTTIDRNGARWTELSRASGYPKECGAAGYNDYCLPERLFVRNETAVPMVCHGEIRMPSGNKMSLSGASRDSIVMGFSSVVLVKAMAAENIHSSSHASDCKPWQPPPPPASRAGCSFKVNAGVIRLDYPQGAREREEEGPVFLSFTLADKSGRPTDIEVTGSSLFPELDAAAVRTLAGTGMTTECPGARFSVLLRYGVGGVPDAPLRGLPPQKSATGEQCKIKPLRFATPDEYYPAESIRREEQGTVTVRMFASEMDGAPLDVTVDTSSGFPALDTGGLLAIMNSKFSTNCPGYSQLYRVKFSLKDDLPAPPPER